MERLTAGWVRARGGGDRRDEHLRALVRLGRTVLLLHGFPQTHLMWRGVAPLLARHFTVVCADLRGYGAAAVPRPRRITRHMRSGRWRATWWSSWNGLDFRASRLPGMTVAVASPIAWRSTIRTASIGWPCSISCRRGRSGSGPTRGSRWPTGPGRCSPSLNRFRSASWRRRLTLSSMTRSAAGALLRPSLRRRFAPPMSRRCAIPFTPMRSARSIGPPRPSIATHDDADRASGRASRARCWRCGAAPGPLGTWYAEAGGPLALWRAWGDDVQGRAIEAGHFFPEESPESRPPMRSPLFFLARP